MKKLLPLQRWTH